MNFTSMLLQNNLKIKHMT